MSVLNQVFVMLFCLSIQFASAGQDYCLPGSDSLCKRYGTDYCCARIQITKNGVDDEYHACASASGINYMDGKFDGGGYSGTWYCDSAKYLSSSIMFMVASLYFTI